MPARISVVPLHQMAVGQYADCFALLAERHRSVTREGKPYFACKFRDNLRTASFMIWADGPWFGSCESEWEVGQFYKVRALYAEHERYGPQIEIHNIRRVVEEDKAEGFDPGLLVESSRFAPDAMFTALTQLVAEQIRDEPLRRLVLALLERFAAKLHEMPATLDRFHPFRGGWLEHTLSVTRTCVMVTDYYLAQYPDLRPPLNRDLLIAAAALHDIGRVLEMSDNPVTPSATIPGELIGHVHLSRDLVRDTARELGDVNPELVLLLEHLVLTHLNLPAWGSARLPMIPECLILHHLDDLDAKLEMFIRCLTRDQNPGPFTSMDPVLKKPLLKQRTV